MRYKLAAGALAAAVLVAVGWAVTKGDSADGASQPTTTADVATPTTVGSGDTPATTAPEVTAAPERSTGETIAQDPDESSPPATTATTTTTPPTTTTTVAGPIDERLPRTGADATQTDPVPVGEVIEADPGVWDIALTAVDLDATDTVLAFADINPEPEPGFQFVLVTVEGTYLGESVAQPVFEWAVLADGTEYWPSIPGCGIVPNPIYDVVEVGPGDSFSARLCMPVASADVTDGIELFLFAPGDEPRYFSLD